jgi:hypothetical protein
VPPPRSPCPPPHAAPPARPSPQHQATACVS